MRKIVVFDIDGTIANNDHRRHFVEQKPKDWKAYNNLMADDGVYLDIVYIMSTLWNDTNNRIILCTGREETYREHTENWLIKVGLFHYINDLYMRKEKDYRSDAIVKVELMKQIEADWGRPQLWFDDRQQVVDAIRAEGIRVLQVQEGNF
jgi:FMN phosphatase YigB (HAD superfamily)